jgi:pantoate--beta-alanine ligase
MCLETKPLVFKTRREVRDYVVRARQDDKRVGVVMTMGALHDGHRSLIEACQSQCDLCILTVFVNPTQFSAGEDFKQYPRDLESDLALLADLNVDVVFAPDRDEMYRPEHSTSINPPSVAARWEGEMREDHFQGVTTIVLKLLHVIPAQVAFFGHKDYQQYAVIRSMVADLDVPVEIVACPTIRAEDGLALSSRNRYLSADERHRALSISAALQLAAEEVAAGKRSALAIQTRLQKALAAALDKIDYVAIVDPESLQPIDKINSPAIALIAAHIGNTRLIDNWRLVPPE